MQYLLKPFSLIYGIFETELAYWITDILIKLTSYFSFFILSKKISKNYFISSLASCIYAYFNANALNGFGTAILIPPPSNRTGLQDLVKTEKILFKFFFK